MQWDVFSVIWQSPPVFHSVVLWARKARYIRRFALPTRDPLPENPVPATSL